MDTERRKWVVRALRWLGIGLVASLVVVNVLANTVLEGWLSDEERKVSWDFAWTLLPGRVHVHGFRMSDRTDSDRWRLEIDEVSAWIELDGLFRQQLVIGSAEASGGRFLIEAHPEPREGSSDGDSDTSDMWLIQLLWADIRPVESVCLFDACVEGPGHVRGGFELAPLERFHVGPSSFEPNGASVRIGETTVAEDVQGRLEVTISEVDIQSTDALGHFEHVDANARLTADLPSLPSLLESMPERGRPDAGDGEVELELAVRDGVVQSDSQLRGSITGAAFRIGDHRAWVAGRIEGTVADGEITLGLRGGRATARTTQAEDMQLEIGDLSAELSGLSADLAHPSLTPRVSVRAKEGLLSDARFVAPWVPGALEPERGTGAVRGSARWRPDTGALDARLDFRGNDWVWRVESVVVKTALVVRGELSMPGDGRLSLAGSRVQLRELSVSESEEDVRDWWGRLAVGEALEVQDARLAHPLTVRVRDARPVLALLEATADPPDLLQRVAEMEGMRGGAQLVVPRGGAPVRLEELSLSGDDLDVEGWIRFGREVEYSLYFDAGLLSLGVVRRGGGTSFHPFGAGM